MNAAPIGSIAAHDEVAPLAGRLASTAAPTAPGADFPALVHQGLQAVSEQLVEGQAALQALATGRADSLHEVMVRMEEARVSFQLMLQVRNRLLEAYQEVMRMQL